MSEKNHPIWVEVEMAIGEEILWLKNNIIPYSPDDNPLNQLDDLFYRLIAILIVSGKIKVAEFDLQIEKISNLETKKESKQHGAEWHNGMILFLKNMFLDMGCEVDFNEPKLYYGHADFKVISDNNVIYFEIDTINIFKLWINLLKMKNIKIASMTDNKLIIFEI